jgi:hypothetical protein
VASEAATKRSSPESSSSLHFFPESSSSFFRFFPLTEFSSSEPLFPLTDALFPESSSSSLSEGLSRRGIVLSDRRKHLIALYALLGGDNGECCLYLGETGKKRKRDRDERAATKRCMLATVSLAEEGLDVPDLSFLVLATPKSEVEQCVGRILRPLPDKPRPAIVDIWDSYSAFAGMKRRREKYYIRAGFNIETH